MPFTATGRLALRPLSLIAVTAIAALSACGSDHHDDPLTVATDKGTVSGSDTPQYRQYLGIPYAAPPVGPLRWQPPQAAAAWTGTRDATQFGPHCAQPPSAFGAVSASEDCLYLNVYVPKSGQGPFPVMFWIHGGALLTGRSNDYDPTALVGQGVMVVTINYRMGPLGFLSHPALSAEQGGASGNYGILDQQAALKWVKANIAAFGGDPGNVTVFGESAGGLSTHSQIVSPLATGLFHKAIVQSGAYTLTPPTLTQAEALGQSFGTGVGCDDQSLTCLRNAPVSAIIANSTKIQIGGTTLPTVDGKVFTSTFEQAYSSGSFNKVPIIQGSNQHEYSLLSAYVTDTVLGREINASEYQAAVDAQFGTAAGFPAGFSGLLLASYPVTITPAWSLDSLLTDAVFSCNGRKVAQLASGHGVPVYSYEFADANAPMVFNLPPRVNGFGAYHAAEIQYVWPKQQTIYYGAPFTAAQTDLSNKMVAYWAQFAKRGDPNVSGSPNWPAYTRANDTYMTLAPNAIAPTTTFGAEHQCAMWTPGT
ncbi:MAG: carboxylesterase/lipase family protein [Burkholderiaceae bacterium]